MLSIKMVAEEIELDSAQQMLLFLCGKIELRRYFWSGGAFDFYKVKHFLFFGNHIKLASV